MSKEAEEQLLQDDRSERSFDRDLEMHPKPHQSLLSRKRQCTFCMPANDHIIWKYWSLATTALCLLFAINLSFHPSSPNSSSLSNLKYPTFATGPSTFSPQRLIPTRFFRDTRYMSLDHTSDYLWQEHMVMATGNVRLPTENGTTELKAISMYHSMHCLAKMRWAMQQALEGVDIGRNWWDDAHWPHCFDYLRSSIMCFADGTLESVTEQPGPKHGTQVHIIDGGVETRYCRDTRPLEDLVRQYGPNSVYSLDAAEGDFEVAPGR